MTEPPTVLVVEDEKGLLTLFSKMIRRLGYTVLEADGGALALEILQQQTPDLLVLDLGMPRVNGFDVLHYIQQTPRLDPLIVLVMTALGQGAAQQPAAARANHWLNKPVLPSQLNEIVAELLNGTPQ